MAKAAALVVDLIVELRARPARAFEAGTELHTFDGVDAEHGLSEPSVQLAIPVHVAAETRRQTGCHDPEGAAFLQVA